MSRNQSASLPSATVLGRYEKHVKHLWWGDRDGTNSTNQTKSGPIISALSDKTSGRAVVPLTDWWENAIVNLSGWWSKQIDETSILIKRSILWKPVSDRSNMHLYKLFLSKTHSEWFWCYCSTNYFIGCTRDSPPVNFWFGQCLII